MVSAFELAQVDWPDKLEFQNTLRAKLVGHGAAIHDIARLAEIDFWRVMIGSRLKGHESEAAEAAQEGAAAGAAAVLRSAMPRGEVILRWLTGIERSVPGDGKPFGPSAWLHAVSCALLARDQDALDVLCEPSHIAASQLPEHLADAFWPFLCSAVACVIRRPDAAAPWITQSEALLARERVSRGDPQVIQWLIRPLVPVLRALSTAHANFNRALHLALDAHREYFTTSGRAADPNRLLALDIAGLAALAADRGCAFDPGELPEFLVCGKLARASIELSFHYEPRRAEREDDPTAFLDLEGFPRETRRHTVVERGDDLVARYEVHAGPGLPHAHIDFALPFMAHSATGASATWTPALDPGERVLLADAYAARAGAAVREGDGPAARAWLSQAVDQLDIVMESIPDGADAIPSKAFASARGRATRDAEPGRFNRERLAAYRVGLVARVAGAASQARGGASSPDMEEAKRLALVMAETLEVALQSLLLELAHDEAGTVRTGLRPRAEDYEKVFQGDAVEVAREVFERMWQDPIELTFPTAEQSDLRIYLAPAGILAEDNELSRFFPGGYRALARWLDPGRVWVAWKYVKPGSRSGLAYDGLVWCDDHWSWFPKPYRALRRLNRHES
jgi:hypothetical protein